MPPASDGLTVAHRPGAQEADCGTAYAAREYRLLPGAEPGPLNGGPGYVAEHDTFTELIFPRTPGVFQALIVRGARDGDLALLRETRAFEAAVQALPGCASWTRAAGAGHRPGPGRGRPGQPVPAASARPGRPAGHRRCRDDN